MPLLLTDQSLAHIVISALSFAPKYFFFVCSSGTRSHTGGAFDGLFSLAIAVLIDSSDPCTLLSIASGPVVFDMLSGRPGKDED